MYIYLHEMGDSKIQISATTFGVGLGFVAAISITLGGAVAYAVTHYTGTRTCACDDYESSVRAKLQKRKKNMSRYTLPAEYSSGSVHDYKTDCRHIIISFFDHFEWHRFAEHGDCESVRVGKKFT
uniref:Uncharacterized protein n=1 Tax=Aplanochytrium stocchinoi TaxID=215587 RepID=A0A7S3V2C3_9STRA